MIRVTWTQAVERLEELIGRVEEGEQVAIVDDERIVAEILLPKVPEALAASAS